MMMMKSLIKAAALFVVLSAAVPSMAAEGWLEGDEFPNITLTTEDGRSLTISDFRGQVVFVNFWASWCPPCVGEFPRLQTLYAAYTPRGVEFVLLNMYEPFVVGREYAQNEGHTIALYDSGYIEPPESVKHRSTNALRHASGTTIDFRPKTIPASFLLDTDRTIIEVWNRKLQLQFARPKFERAIAE